MHSRSRYKYNARLGPRTVRPGSALGSAILFFGSLTNAPREALRGGGQRRRSEATGASVAGQPAGLALRSSSRSAKAEVEVIVSYRSSADSVAKAMQRVNICASEKPARHDQEGRPHVG